MKSIDWNKDKTYLVRETEIWIIKKLNLNSKDEIYCICNDYEVFKSEMQKICDEDNDYIFDNDCIYSPRGIEYEGCKTKFVEKVNV